jgi:hypothetical protein
MPPELDLILNGYRLEFASITQELKNLRIEMAKKSFADGLPEWINLERAAEMKGGAAFSTYKTRLFLQPCCGRNFRLVGGRKVWRKEDVIRWLDVDDDGLAEYAREFHATLPDTYTRTRRVK